MTAMRTSPSPPTLTGDSRGNPRATKRFRFDPLPQRHDLEAPSSPGPACVQSVCTLSHTQSHISTAHKTALSDHSDSDEPHVVSFTGVRRNFTEMLIVAIQSFPHSQAYLSEIYEVLKQTYECFLVSSIDISACLQNLTVSPPPPPLPPPTHARVLLMHQRARGDDRCDCCCCCTCTHSTICTPSTCRLQTTPAGRKQCSRASPPRPSPFPRRRWRAFLDSTASRCPSLQEVAASCRKDRPDCGLFDEEEALL